MIYTKVPIYTESTKGERFDKRAGFILVEGVAGGEEYLDDPEMTLGRVFGKCIALGLWVSGGKVKETGDWNVVISGKSEGLAECSSLGQLTVFSLSNGELPREVVAERRR